MGSLRFCLAVQESSRYLRFPLVCAGIGHKVLQYCCWSAHYSWTGGVFRLFVVLDELLHILIRCSQLALTFYALSRHSEFLVQVKGGVI